MNAVDFSFARMRLVLVALAASFLVGSADASDHADPQSIYVFQLQSDPVANITDLHAFLVDAEQKLITDQSHLGDADQLIISICARRRLLPDQVGGLMLKGYSFQVHLDLDPAVRFFEEKPSWDEPGYNAETERLRKIIDEKPDSPAESQKLRDLLTERATHDADRSMQALYGGIVTKPNDIAEEVTLEFRLDLSVAEDKEQSEAIFDGKPVIKGVPGDINIVVEDRNVAGAPHLQPNPFKSGVVNVQAGVFDDPFIFPRFYRGNVVGAVTSIPLAQLHSKDGQSFKAMLAAGLNDGTHLPILLWATSHDKNGKQNDHVGRSLRTQLPRFGYLNEMHPSKHVDEITRVHMNPTIMEDILATFLSPLEAHRHYDGAPDVMIYDLTKPARFPNGRALADDISKTLADAGETLLFELSYSESRQFPRATINDKPFREKFPYLALRWTQKEIDDNKAPGTALAGGFAVPRAQDPAATASPTFKDDTWKSLWRAEVIGLVLLTVLLLGTLRSLFPRLAVIILTAVVVCILQPVRALNLMAGPGVTVMDVMKQPGMKVIYLLVGGVVIGVLGIAWLYVFGKRWGEWRPVSDDPAPHGNEGITPNDSEYKGSTYKEVYDAVFAEPYYGKVWGAEGQEPLPIHDVSFWTLASGIFTCGKRFDLVRAIRRTLSTRADLRWGDDRKGFRRLIHPNGTCLAGEWIIDDAPTGYTGYFQEGRKGLIIARHSPARAETRRGGWRSMGLVGKIYPTLDSEALVQPASFFTQEDLGGTTSASINDSVHINAPDVHAWRRGKGVFSLILTGLFFARINVNATIRQLHEIAELRPPGEPEIKNPRCPTFMRFQVDKNHADSAQNIPGDELDVRDEILTHIYDKGNPAPKRQLVYTIEVSNHDQNAAKTHLTDALIERDIPESSWKRIGRIVFKEAVCSYNGDFVIHFPHPKWRKDPGDAATVAPVK